MSLREKFTAEINEGYAFEGKSIVLGGAMLDGECNGDALVKLPLKTLNRHGLIAGATGSGKTKTLQILAEQFSNNSIPVLLMDVKGDLSGIAAESPGHIKIDERHVKIGIPFEAGASPVEFLSLSGEPGARLRATVSEFGPILFSKILNLNETQSGVVAVIFKYCDDKQLPLLDLKDFKKTLQYVSGDGKEEVEKEYGRISPSTIGSITRKIVEIEQQGAELFFGETSFDVEDLCRFDENGKGMVSIIRLTDLQDRPKLFSTFMLQMLAEIYATFPEQGDAEQPELAIFIDEAHLVFDKASDALLEQIEAIIKLIRSKGVGIFFVTQNPNDIPDEVLGQLGMKVQHTLRAFTAKDRKAIKLSAQNYPITEYYDTEQLLTDLGIGEALVTVLDETGRPTPLVHCLLRAPQSRMDILTENEIEAIIAQSKLIKKYNEEIDRESAYEILNKKIESAQAEEHQSKLKEQQAKAEQEADKKEDKRSKKDKSLVENFTDDISKEFSRSVNQQGRRVTRTLTRELTRGLLGALGIRRGRW